MEEIEIVKLLLLKKKLQVIVKNIDSNIEMILDVISTQLYTVEESYPKFIKIIEK